MNLRDWTAELLFPPRCPFCGQTIAKGLAFCGQCREQVPMPLYVIPLDSAKGLVCCTPFSYEGQVRSAIGRYKFQGKKMYDAAFGAAMAQAFTVCFAGARPDLVTFVPLSAKRRRARSYDQAKLLAQKAAGQLGLPCRRTLVKRKENAEQHRLSREQRRRNVLGVYSPYRKAQVAGKTVLLCDDIVTTGATLLECAQVLLRQGARAVYCAAVAATPSQSKG